MLAFKLKASISKSMQYSFDWNINNLKFVSD